MADFAGGAAIDEVGDEPVAVRGHGDSLRSQQQHRHADAVADGAGRRSEKQVGDESVPVRAHGHQIATFFLNPFDDFVGWLAKRQLGVGVDAR